MPKLRVILLIVVFGTGCFYYYLSEISTQITLLVVTSPTPTYTIVEINDRVPFYKLATLNGRKPYAGGDRAQATVVKHLQLVENCKRDPSLIVVDVGAFLGDFGLYAAACGCQVYIFEVQPKMVELIQASISINNFSSSRVHIINKAISDLPSNSQLTFSTRRGKTTAANGPLRVSTIRLDDVSWPPQSTIFLLKVDVEGLELNVLRSAQKLFAEKRIHHLIFEYTAWWTKRGAQKDLLPFVENNLDAKKLYVLDRTSHVVYGPLSREVLDEFHENHVKRRVQTDIYTSFDDSNTASRLETQVYNPESTYA